jgi:hypothetical protein
LLIAEIGDFWFSCRTLTGTLELVGEDDSTIKMLDRRRSRAQAEARMAVFQFIEGFYNPSRRHSALGDLSPIEYERSAKTTLETYPKTVHETGVTSFIAPPGGCGPGLF